VSAKAEYRLLDRRLCLNRVKEYLDKPAFRLPGSTFLWTEAGQFKIVRNAAACLNLQPVVDKPGDSLPRPCLRIRDHPKPTWRESWERRKVRQADESQ